MSYVVLARKLRPTQFADLVGQETIGNMLKKAVNTQKLTHAFLFTGPRGTGKTSCARILAKAVNCENPQQGEPCNACPSCMEIQKGGASDILEIDAASNRGIEHIRELRESVKYAPAMSRYKIYIIDEVHMLTTESFNALLKTLEEPPSHVIFILATTDFHKIPLTVGSRCQRFDFTYITAETITSFLEETAKKENISITKEALKLVAKQANGGMRDALTMLDMLVSYTDNEITETDARNALGLYDVSQLGAILRAILTEDTQTAITVFHNELASGRSLSYFLTALLQKIKDLRLFLKLGENNDLWRSISQDERALYQELLTLANEEQLSRYFAILLQAEQQIKQSKHRELCMEMAILDLCSIGSLESAKEIIALLRQGAKAIEAMPDEAIPQALPKQEEQPASQEQEENNHNELNLLDKWNEFCSYISLSDETALSGFLSILKLRQGAKAIETMPDEAMPQALPKQEENNNNELNLLDKWNEFCSYVSLSDETILDKELTSILPHIKPISFAQNTLTIECDDATLLTDEKQAQLKERINRFMEQEIIIVYKDVNEDKKKLVSNDRQSESVPEQAQDLQAQNKSMLEEQEQGLQEQGLQEQGLQEQGLQEQGLQEQGLQEQGLQEQGLQEQGLQEQGLQEQGLQEQGLQEQGLQEQGLQEQDVSTLDWQTKWKAFLSFIAEDPQNEILHSFLKNIEPISFANDKLILQGNNVAILDSVKKDSIKEQAANFFEKNVTIEYIEASTDVKNTVYHQEENEKRQEWQSLKEQAKTDELVQDLQGIFPDSVIENVRENKIKE